jgi:2-polyprenyl-3-methyl-5-hydroxy-6-metoxy-1,4-benzoquinol methylase
MFELRRKYDVVHVTDVRCFSWPTRYDVVILGDVLEHLTLADALRVWASARARACYVVLSIPIVEYLQGVHYGNIHETHLHVWSHESVVDQLDGIRRWQRHAAIGVYLADGTC